MDTDANGVILCCKCGQTTTLDKAFAVNDKEYVCHDCVLLEETLKRYLADCEKVSAKEENAGRKNDQQKLRVDLIPPELIAMDAAVYTMGAEKYDDDNWKLGLKYRRLLAAIQRHLLQRCMGERVDSESGLPHLAHARWNIGAMLYYDLHEQTYKSFDDVTSKCDEVANLLNGVFPWQVKGVKHG